MNTHHQVVEQVISSHPDSNCSSPELMGTEDPNSFKRNYQVEQIYTVAPTSQYQVIPSSSVRSDNSYQGQLNLSSYSGPAYLLTTAADGTQQLQPLQEQSLGNDTPQILIENVQQVEEIPAMAVASAVPEQTPVPIIKTTFAPVLKKNRPFKCDQCTASYLEAAELDEHKSKHTDDGPFTCVDCHFTFMFKSHYRSHRTRCEKKRGQAPSTCSPYVLEYHSVKHKFPKNVIKKQSSQQEMVYLNVDSIHAASRKTVNASKQTASARFNPKNPTFKRTKRIGRIDRPYECDECDATFKVDSDLKTHKMKHTGEGPFKCEECEFVFLFRKLYESHQRRCTKKLFAALSTKKQEAIKTSSVPSGDNGQDQPQEPGPQEVAVSLPGSSTNYASNQSPMPVYNQPTIIEMRAAQPTEILQVQHSIFDQQVVAATSSNPNRQDVKYELVPTVELDGMSMNQIVNLIKVKAPSQQ